MENEIKKSYNPFKMWGSWVGFILGIIGIFGYLVAPFFLIDSSILLDNLFIGNLQAFGGGLMTTNPIFWLSVLFFGEGAIRLILIIALTTPLVLFLYGWGIHSIFRKLNKTGRIILSITILVILGLVFLSSYLIINTAINKRLSTLESDIHSRDDTIAMNAVMLKEKSETNTIAAMDKMFYIARDESILIDARLIAIQSLSSRVTTMNSNEKSILTEYLDNLNYQINTQNKTLDLSKESDQMIKFNNDRLTSRIVILQNLVNK